MLNLASTSDQVSVITSAAGAIHVHVSWVDYNTSTFIAAPGRTNTAPIATATTTTVLAAPAASTVRNIKFLSIQNTSATVTNVITVNLTDGTNNLQLASVSLNPYDSLEYSDASGWTYVTLAGGITTGAGVNANATNANININDTSGSGTGTLTYQSNGTTYWQWQKSAANSLNLQRYVSGTYADNPITISTSTGVVTFADGFVSPIHGAVGTDPGVNVMLGVQSLATGSSTATGTVQVGIYSNFYGNTSGTTDVRGIYSVVGTSAAAYSVTNAYSFLTGVPVLGAGSSLTNFSGYYAQSSAAATNNYSFNAGQLAGANNLGFYNSGNSNNNLGTGTTTVGTLTVNTGASITGAAGAQAAVAAASGYTGTAPMTFWANGTAPTTATSQYYGYVSNLSTVAATWTLPSLIHYTAGQGTCRFDGDNAKWFSCCSFDDRGDEQLCVHFKYARRDKQLRILQFGRRKQRSRSGSSNRHHANPVRRSSNTELRVQRG